MHKDETFPGCPAIFSLRHKTAAALIALHGSCFTIWYLHCENNCLSYQKL